MQVGELRLANMFYEQRGPLVFSASLHLAALVLFGVWALVSPEKPPEELVFEIVEPPSGGYAPPPALEPLAYETEEVAMPTEEEMTPPESPMVPVPSEPVVETIPVEKRPQPTSLEDFERQFGKIEMSNVRRTPRENRPAIDLSAELKALRDSLSEISIESLPRAEINASSAADQRTLASYLARFRALVARNIERHPISGDLLRVTIRCDILAGGQVTNITVVRSSGDPVFDRKAVAAFGAIRIFDAPPGNKPLLGLSFPVLQE